MLERVIHRVFKVGLLLQNAAGDDHAEVVTGSVLEELKRALTDLHAAGVAWEIASERRRDPAPVDDLGAAISHLSAAAEILRGPYASLTAKGEATRHAAATDACHAVHLSLIILEELSSDPTNSEADPPGREAGPATEH